ncbi:MAG: hypothetical protein WKF43_06830 [Acidimicrobiales bacterium]
MLPAWFPPLPAVAHRTRDVLRVTGRDTVAYLQGQLSQDIAGLAVGDSAWSFVLQPQGKVDAWVRVHRAGEAEVALDVDCGAGRELLARLKRFMLRTECDLVLDEGVPTVSIRGAMVVAGLPCRWPGIDGCDLIGADALPEDGPELTGLDDEGFEVLRIASGVPAMGRELTEATIPAEVGQWVIDASVSFTKGCFTGQELVARIDSRGGNVPRRLTGFVAAGSPPPPGAELLVAGAAAGTVTSCARSPDGTVVGLASVKRSITVPGPAAIGEIGVELRPPTRLRASADRSTRHARRRCGFARNKRVAGSPRHRLGP